MNPSLRSLVTRDDVRKLFSVLGAEDCRLVGGVVRDALKRLELKDFDLATRLSPIQMCNRLKAGGIRFVSTGLSHGTITAWIEGTRFDITRLRRDKECDGRHSLIVPIEDWDEDAKRRDFTINAIYADAKGNIFDPLGGVADLRAGKVRFIGDPWERIKEDYLRILRFFRFSAIHGESDPDAAGLSACIELRTGLDKISGERIRDELNHILLLERWRDALGWMTESGVLEICLGGQIKRTSLARLDALKKLEARYGLAVDVGLRFATLLEGTEAARTAGRRLRFSRICGRRLIRGLGGILDATPSKLEIKALLYRNGKRNALDIVLLSWVKCETSEQKNGERKGWNKAFKEVVSGEVPYFPLTGKMVISLGIEEGIEVGNVLAYVETCWIAEGFTGDKNWALNCARDAIERLSLKVQPTTSNVS